jgi:hypothetical protein
MAFIVSAAASVVIPVSATSDGGGNVQGYGSSTVLTEGTIVELTGANATSVKIATKSELQNMFGVTVDPSQLLVTSTNAGLQNETYVAVSGTYDVLVSTEGGSIATGDYLTLSSIDGVAMKASTDQPTVFGRAAAPFDGKGLTLGTSTIKDTSGTVIQTVTLGEVPVSIEIEHNPNVKSTKEDVPQFLQRLGEQIADKQVSPIKIYLSMAITAAAIITAIVILYSGVRNGVTAIGRNPMSKKSVFRALLEIILTSILILIIGLSAVYLLLKL